MRNIKAMGRTMFLALMLSLSMMLPTAFAAENESVNDPAGPSEESYSETTNISSPVGSDDREQGQTTSAAESDSVSDTETTNDASSDSTSKEEDSDDAAVSSDTGVTSGEEDTGETGEDTSDGETGEDTSDGETGEDTSDGETGEDTSDGETGEDTSDGETGEDTSDGETGEDTSDGETGEDTSDGETGEDTSDGETGEDTSDGETGEDTSDGETGEDTSDGETGEDTSDGETGEDTSDGETGEDTSDGETGEDTSDGETGEDTSDGETGEDTSDGETGEDTSDGETAETPSAGDPADVPSDDDTSDDSSDEKPSETTSGPEAVSGEGTDPTADTTPADGAIGADVPMLFSLETVKGTHTALDVVNELLENEQGGMYTDDDAEFAKDIATLIDSFSADDLQKAGVADLLAALKADGLSKNEAIVAVRKLQAILSMTNDDTGIDDAEKLQNAINNANKGDTIKISGDINGSFSIGDKDITLDLQGHTITGSGDKSVIVIRGSAGSGSSVKIQNGTITGGKAQYGGGIQANNILLTLYNLIVKGNSGGNGGGVYAGGGSLTVDLSTIDSNEAARSEKGFGGGGIYANGTKLTVTDSAVQNNTTGNSGGGVVTSNSNVEINRSNFTGNDALYTGGIYIYKGNATLKDVIVSGNTATAWGGAIQANSANVSIIDSKIDNNKATNGNAGGIYTTGSTTKLTGSVIEGNSGYYGGGIMLQGGSVELKDSRVLGNHAGAHGGGIYQNNGGTLTLDGVEMSGNTSSYSGGGIYVNDAETTISNSTISNNTANSGGGGIYANGTTATISNTTISNNTAKSDGGGIYSDAATLNISNGSVIEGNSSYYGGGIVVNGGSVELNTGSKVLGNYGGAHGGGIYQSNAGTLTLDDAEVRGNTSPHSGGGIYVKDGTTTIRNSVISDNTANNGGGIYANGTSTTISGSTISGNTAKYDGGGIFAADRVSVTGSTISGNKAANGGGIWGSTELKNTRIEKNQVTENGGGIYSNNDADKTIADDTVITGNTAGKKGGGVYVGISSMGFVLNSGALHENHAAGSDSDIFVQVLAGYFDPNNFQVKLPNIWEMKDGDKDFSEIGYINSDSKVFTSGVNIAGRHNEKDLTISASYKPEPGIFINGVNGNNANSGTDRNSAVQSFQKAVELAKAYGYKFIYVMDKILVNDTQTWKDPVTLARYVLYDTYKGHLVEVQKNGNLTIKNVTLDGAKNQGVVSNYNGSLIRVNGGTLELGDGAVLQNNELAQLSNSTAGAGLYITNGGKVLMTSGSRITNNVANVGRFSGGGGVYLTGEDSRLTIDGGEISSNKVTGTDLTGCFGGGIYVTDDATLVMKSGTICGNTAYSGGGVALGRGKFDLRGGDICHNEAYYNTEFSDGGGVSVLYNGELHMSGGTIANNKAWNGGGVILGNVYNSAFYDGYRPQMFMTGGTITGNESKGSGGGIYIQMNGVATIGSPDGTNGTIELTNNTAHGGAFSGGAIYVNGGKSDKFVNGLLKLYNAEITDNTGVLAGCPTSNVEIHVTDGAVIHDNKGSKDIYVSAVLTVGPHGYYSGNPNITLSAYMLGGGAYNWVDQNGEPIPLDTLNRILESGKKFIANTHAQNVTGLDQTTVLISGNVSHNNMGGAIGSNGDVIIGQSSPVTDLIVNKQWNDKDNINGVRPDYVDVEVYQYDQDGNESFFGVIRVKKDEDWTAKFTGLPLTDVTGTKKYTYKISEKTDDHYVGTVVEKISEDLFIFDLINTLATKINIEKIWDDVNSKNEIVGKRPDSISVEIRRETEGSESGPALVEVVEIKPDENGKWSYSGKFAALDADGNELLYSIFEKELQNYLSSLTGGKQEDGNYTYTITNTPVTEITIEKIWNDLTNKGEMIGSRPGSIAVEIKQQAEGSKNAVTVAVVELTPDANGKWVYTGKYKLLDENKNLLTYSVIEQALANYLSSLNGGLNADGNYDFTITNTPAAKVEIEKVWNDINSKGEMVGRRPGSIFVEIKQQAEGSAEAVTAAVVELAPDANGKWVYTGKYALLDENKNLLSYSVIEQALANYLSSLSGGLTADGNYAFTITNTPAATLEINKVWNDVTNKGETVGKRPESIFVEIKQQAEGSAEAVTVAVVELAPDANGKWAYTGKYALLDENQNMLSYSIIEQALEDYLSSLSGGLTADGNYSFVLTNTPATTLEIDKIWNDINSKGEMVGNRPDSIFVEIKQQADGSAEAVTVAVVELVPDANGNWVYTGKYALLDENQNKLSYSIIEQALEDYLSSLSGGLNADGSYSFTLTNTAIAPITVMKDWVDENGNRITDTANLQSITVDIYDEHGNKVDTVVLNAENNWSYTNKYDATVSYQVTEVTTIDGWTGTVTDNGDGTFTITNQKDKEPEQPNVPEIPDTPDTPDVPETPDVPVTPEEEDDDEPTPEEIPDEPTPLTEEPSEEVPTTEVLDEDVPLAEIPDEEVPLDEILDEEVPLAELPDMDIPLADVPQTGDNGVMMLYLALVLCLGGVLLLKKRENEV